MSVLSYQIDGLTLHAPRGFSDLSSVTIKGLYTASVQLDWFDSPLSEEMPDIASWVRAKHATLVDFFELEVDGPLSIATAIGQGLVLRTPDGAVVNAFFALSERSWLDIMVSDALSSRAWDVAQELVVAMQTKPLAHQHGIVTPHFNLTLPTHAHCHPHYQFESVSEDGSELMSLSISCRRLTREQAKHWQPERGPHFKELQLRGEAVSVNITVEPAVDDVAELGLTTEELAEFEEEEQQHEAQTMISFTAKQRLSIQTELIIDGSATLNAPWFDTLEQLAESINYNYVERDDAQSF